MQLAGRTALVTGATVQLRGVDQTVPGNAGNLRLAAHQGTTLMARSDPFSVSSIPQNWSVSFNRLRTGADRGIVVNDSWESDSGVVADLDETEISEEVQNDPGTGIFASITLSTSGFLPGHWPWHVSMLAASAPQLAALLLLPALLRALPADATRAGTPLFSRGLDSQAAPASQGIRRVTLLAFAAGALLPDDEYRRERAFFAGGVGYNLGLGGGLLGAHALSPSVARARLVDLLGIAGGLATAGLYLSLADDPATRTTEGLAVLGAGAGLATGWILTSGMPKDTTTTTPPGAASAKPTFQPTLGAVRGGATLGLGGTL